MGKPLLFFELERLKQVAPIDQLLVATTTNPEDDPIIALCDDLGVSSYRGSEHDVLSRYYEAAKQFKADVVVRFTADCPMVDPYLATSIILEYIEARGYLDYIGIDYASIPRGVDVEVFSFAALECAYYEGKSKLDREHVTWYIHRNPQQFKISRYAIKSNWSHYRLTVDTLEDFHLVKAVFERLYEDNPFFTLETVIALLMENSELTALNSEIKQKHYSEKS